MTCIILEKGLLSQDIKNKNGYLRKTLYCINDIVTNIKLKKKKTFYWIKIFPTAIKYVHLTMYVYINVNIQCLYMISCFVCVCVWGRNVRNSNHSLVPVVHNISLDPMSQKVYFCLLR